MAWIRAVLVCAQLAALAAGCDQGGGGEPAGKGAVAAGPAGEVIHVEGAVTATRPGEEARVLEAGSPVSADDTIAVPMNAEISIVLAHNKVQWDIGSGQSYRVDQSRAWKAQAGSGSALDEQGELGTASAGRHGEREAGDTEATASAEATLETSREVAAVPPPQKPEEVHRSTASDESAPAVPRETLRGKALGMTPEEVAPRAESDSESKAVPGASSPTGGSGGGAAAPRRALAVALGDIKVRGALAQADVARVFASFSAAACGVSQTGAVVLRFEISGDGSVLKPRLTGPAALVAEVKTCVTTAARKLGFPATTAGSTFVEREIRFSAKSK
ncbi:MAG TPA: hypothetical protein VMZ28_04850 [Kofleriaceae bacterium]|nr:hypothetical protein [Kofleriaceae bacterium]